MNTSASFIYEDSLRALNRDAPLSEKLASLHQVVRDRYPFVDRIAVAVYDPKTDLLKTFLHSGDAAQPLVHYQAKLAEVPSLLEVVRRGRPRVVNNLEVFRDSRREHAVRLRNNGYSASYTQPLYARGAFFGFVFFNSREPEVFQEECLHYLDLIGHLLGLTVVNELNHAQTLAAAIRTTAVLTQHRDPETGSHLDRMARYARIIALELAPKHGLNDEFIEHLFLFAPLHDVGKIGIPDEILLKKGRLTVAEYEVMKTHARKGREIIDALLENFSLGRMTHGDMLRNIAEYHHEAMNGSGYPEGLAGAAIPVESRIVAVADVFDALTSSRPYKHAWSNDEAFAELERLADSQLDRECVEALRRNCERVEEIQALFQENYYG